MHFLFIYIIHIILLPIWDDRRHADMPGLNNKAQCDRVSVSCCYLCSRTLRLNGTPELNHRGCWCRAHTFTKIVHNFWRCTKFLFFFVMVIRNNLHVLWNQSSSLHLFLNFILIVHFIPLEALLIEKSSKYSINHAKNIRIYYCSGSELINLSPLLLLLSMIWLFFDHKPRCLDYSTQHKAATLSQYHTHILYLHTVSLLCLKWSHLTVPILSLPPSLFSLFCSAPLPHYTSIWG